MFDGSSLTIRGDLGEFLLDRYGSEPAALWLGNMRDPYYIKSKMRCATDEYDHIDEIFEADLAEWFAGQGCSDEDDEETEATIRELWHDCKEFLEMALCSDKKMVERYDYEDITHVGGFGRVLSARFILVVEGLKMALEQLGEVEKP
jgi:hypothetical protein